MTFLAIMASDPSGVIGKEGKLPWHCPQEFEYFLHTTLGHVVIMGRRTYDAMPKRYLEGRTSIVISHGKHLSKPPHLFFVNSINEIPSFSDCLKYVIGGGEIIRLFLKNDLISEMILTEMRDNYEGDVYFPRDLLHRWPRKVENEAKDFIIYRYFKPKSV